MAPPKYKLTYFNVVALAEPIKVLLHYGNIPFEDVKIEKENWPALKEGTPFGKLPTLEIDGKTYHQSSAIYRHLARKLKLMGSFELETLEIEMVLDTQNDLRQSLYPMILETDETKKAAVAKTLQTETLPYYFEKFAKIVKENNGYFVKGKLSLADICFYLLAERLDFMFGPATIDKHPELRANMEKVLSVPQIKAYISSRKIT